MVEEFKAGTKEVGFNITNKVLAIHGKVIALARYGKIAIFGHSLSKQLAMVRSNKGAVLLLYRLRTFSFICEGFALLNKSIKVRIITEHTLFRSLPQNFGQVMHIICQHVGLEFICRDLLRRSNQ